MEKRKCTILNILIIFFLIVAVIMFVFPEAEQQLYQVEQKRIISEYEKVFSTRSENTKRTKTKPKSKNNYTSEPPKINLRQLKADIKRYNNNLYKEHQINLTSTYSCQISPINLYNYGFTNEVYGFLTIDKINLRMAIYLGASEYNMSIGAACLSQTSIPFGGANTNSVIAGHCGYGGRHYFRYIDNLNLGDNVKLTTPFNTREYQVFEKKIINPNDTGSIFIREGMDIITLMTCYPYPTDKYRVCVFCKAVPPRDNERK